jgi:hypothetical protein
MQYIILLMIAALSGCTVSITQVQSDGYAKDMVQEDQSPQEDLNLSLER